MDIHDNVDITLENLRIYPKISALQYENTVDVLKSIAKHLSSRRECRGKEYRVAISVRDDKQLISRDWPFDVQCSIFFDTPIKLYKGKGRKWSNGRPAIQHIMIEHFNNMYAGVANGNQVQIYPHYLLPGIYEYKMSVNGKGRKWFKIG